MNRRQEFYKKHPEGCPFSKEDCGQDTNKWYILPDDPISLALSPVVSHHFIDEQVSILYVKKSIKHTWENNFCIISTFLQNDAINYCH